MSAPESARTGVPVRYSHSYERSSPLGSVEFEPLRVMITFSPASGGPVATASGGSFTLLSTRTARVTPFWLPSVSRTVSSNSRSSGCTTCGAVNVGASAVAFDSVIPCGAVHRYVRVSPLGSEDLRPLRVMIEFSSASSGPVTTATG